MWCLETAFDVFKTMDKKDLICWNTIIGGLAVPGNRADALNLISQMKSSEETLDGITFIGISCARTHMGLVEDGSSYFKSMTNEYSIAPQIEHYGCQLLIY
ncbi:hypothetical protein OIU78_004883 [Salix suchowensis]|nr:hypothetical protein OIU78_004883 [Salix suchowensis]